MHFDQPLRTTTRAALSTAAMPGLPSPTPIRRTLPLGGRGPLVSARFVGLLCWVACQLVQSGLPGFAETRLVPPPASSAGAAELQLPFRGICGHRGASSTHPENTLTALREAIRLGAHMVEFDVALTRDERVVLMHDATIDRTTTGSGKLSDWSFADLRLLDAGGWRGAQFAGEKVPTLVEALAVMPTNIWLNVHLKGSNLLAEKTTRQLRDANRLHQAFLACGRGAAKVAKQIEPRIQICNMDRQAEPAQYAEDTIQAGAGFIQLLGGQRGSLEQIPLLRKHQLRINWCCTDDADQIRKLFAAGVEFVLVDQVEAALATAEALGIERLQPQFRAERENRVK